MEMSRIMPQCRLLVRTVVRCRPINGEQFDRPPRRRAVRDAIAGGAGGGDGGTPRDHRVRLDTTKGRIIINVHRDWAPHGANRFFELVTAGLLRRQSFLPRRRGSIGAGPRMSGDPVRRETMAGTRRPQRIAERSEHVAGMVAFAFAAPDARTTQVYIRLEGSAPNPQDGQGSRRSAVSSGHGQSAERTQPSGYSRPAAGSRLRRRPISTAATPISMRETPRLRSASPCGGDEMNTLRMCARSTTTTRARDRMFEALELLTPDAADRDRGNSFKWSIRDTVTHLYAAEWVSYHEWQGTSPTALLATDTFPDLAAVRPAGVDTSARCARLWKRLGESGVEARVELQIIQRPGRRGARFLADAPARRAKLRRTYHRGQVTTMLRRVGAPAKAARHD